MSEINSNLPLEIGISKSYEFVPPSKLRYQSQADAKTSVFSDHPATKPLSATGWSYRWQITPSTGYLDVPELEFQNLVFHLTLDGDGNLAPDDLKNDLGISTFAESAVTQRIDFNQYGVNIQTFPAQMRFLWAGMNSIEVNSLITNGPEPDNSSQYVSLAQSNVLRDGFNSTSNTNTRGLGLRYNSVLAVVDAQTVSWTIPSLICRLPSDAFDFKSEYPTPLNEMDAWSVELTLNPVVQSLVRSGVAGLRVALQAGATVNLRLHTKNLVAQIQPSLNYTYPWANVIPHEFGGSVQLPANSQTVVTIPLIREDVVPDMHVPYVVVNRGENDFGPDRTLPITRVNVTVNNKPSLLNDHSTRDLYNLAVSNGYVGSFAQFSGLLLNPAETTAADQVYANWSILPIRPSQMPLDEELLSGVRKEYKMVNLQLTIANRTPDAIPVNGYTIHVPFIYGGYIEFKGRRIHNREVVVPVAKTLADAPQVYLEDDSEHAIQGGRGGKGWKKFVNFLKKAAPFARGASKVIRNAPGVSQIAGDNTALGQVLSMAGAGVTHVGGGVTHVGGGVLSSAQAGKMGKGY